MYTYTHTYRHIVTINKNDAMNLTERKEGYMEGLEGEKKKGEIL